LKGTLYTIPTQRNRCDRTDTIGIKPEEYGVISGDLAKIYQKLIVENKEQMAMADIEHVKNNLTIYRASGNYKNIQN